MISCSYYCAMILEFLEKHFFHHIGFSFTTFSFILFAGWLIVVGSDTPFVVFKTTCFRVIPSRYMAPGIEPESLSLSHFLSLSLSLSSLSHPLLSLSSSFLSLYLSPLFFPLSLSLFSLNCCGAFLFLPTFGGESGKGIESGFR